MKPDIAKLERALIKAAMLRYKEWRDIHGEPYPWGHRHAIKSRSGHKHVMACKALYDATEQARAIKGRKG